jgi:PKD repeat protein
VSNPALTLYGHAADASLRFDVTEGGNGFCGGESVAECGHANTFGAGLIDCEGTTACNAAAGFDGPSGIGTPKALGLFKPLPPTASFTSPGSPTAGIAAAFNGGSSSDPYPGGSISSYSWKWGDGTANGSGVAPTHAYATSGTYSVSLSVTDNYGLASASSTKTIEVSSNPAAEEEAAKHKQEEEQAAAQHKQEEEQAAKRKVEEEAAATQKHEEETAVAIPATALTSTTGQGSVALPGYVPPVPDARLVGTAFTASTSGAVTLKVSCPAGKTSCKGTVTLRTLTAVSAGAASSAKKKAILTLASGSFSVAGGKTASVTLHLSVRARALLRRVHTLRAAATIVAHDASGATHTTKSTVTLHAAKPKHPKH